MPGQDPERGVREINILNVLNQESFILGLQNGGFAFVPQDPEGYAASQINRSALDPRPASTPCLAPSVPITDDHTREACSFPPVRIFALSLTPPRGIV